MLTRTRNELLIAGATVLIAFAVGRVYLRAPSEPVVPPDPQGVRVTSNVVEGDHCPELTSWVASPLRTSVGGSIDVAADARDLDPGQILTFSWSPIDNFSTVHSKQARYQCKQSGRQAITLDVSDNVTPVPCVTRLSFAVECVDP